MEQILLDLQSIICCESNNIIINIAVELTLICDRLVSFSANAILIGVCKALHDENSICKLYNSIAVSIATNNCGLCSRLTDAYFSVNGLYLELNGLAV